MKMRPTRFSHSRLLAASLTLSVAMGGVALPVLAIEPASLEHYRKAADLERDGRLEEAVRELRSAIAADPYDQLNFIKLASVLAQLGNTNEAVAMYKKAAQLDAKDAMIYFSLGALYEQAGQYDEAAEAYNIGLRKNPDYAFGRFNLARTLAQAGKYPEAVEEYRQFAVHYPDHYDARRHLAHLYMVTDQEPMAVETYERLKRDFPQRFTDHLPLAKALNRANEPKKALQELKNAYAKEGNKADIAVEMGNAHASLGQTRYAIQNYRKALDIMPDNPATALRLAELYVTNNEPAEAVPYYQTYLREHPEDVRARQALTHVYLKTGNYDGAIAELNGLIIEASEAYKTDEAYQLRKQLAFAHQMKGDTGRAVALYEGLVRSDLGRDDVQVKKNLAIAYHKQGRLEQAIPLYRDVYTESPQENPVLGNDLANALTQVGDQFYRAGKPDEARARYQEAITYAQPGNVNPHLALAQVAFDQRYKVEGGMEKAVSAYQIVLSADPANEMAKVRLARLDIERSEIDHPLPVLEELARNGSGNPEVYTALATIYQTKGDVAGAVNVYEKAIALQPENDGLMVELGNLWRQLGKLAEALKTYEQARRVNPKNAMAHYNLGILYGERGDLAASENAFRTAIRLNPHFSDAHYGLGVTLEKAQKSAEALKTYEHYTTLAGGHYLTQAQSRISFLRAQLAQDAKAHQKAQEEAQESSNTKEPVQDRPVEAVKPAVDPAILTPRPPMQPALEVVPDKTPPPLPEESPVRDLPPLDTNTRPHDGDGPKEASTGGKSPDGPAYQAVTSTVEPAVEPVERAPEAGDGKISSTAPRDSDTLEPLPPFDIPEFRYQD